MVARDRELQPTVCVALLTALLVTEEERRAHLILPGLTIADRKVDKDARLFDLLLRKAPRFARIDLSSLFQKLAVRFRQLPPAMLGTALAEDVDIVGRGLRQFVGFKAIKEGDVAAGEIEDVNVRPARSAGAHHACEAVLETGAKQCRRLNGELSGDSTRRRSGKVG